MVDPVGEESSSPGQLEVEGSSECDAGATLSQLDSHAADVTGSSLSIKADVDSTGQLATAAEPDLLDGISGDNGVSTDQGGDIMLCIASMYTWSNILSSHIICSTATTSSSRR